MKQSKYKSASGHTVHLFQTEHGYVTEIQETKELTVYSASGELLSGAKDLESALKFINQGKAALYAVE